VTNLGDLLLIVAIVSAFATVAYLIGLERGRHKGWDDARELGTRDSDVAEGV